MKNPNDGFLRRRIRSLKYAFKGLWILITTEDSIKVQLFVTCIAIILGFIFNLSAIEWMFQFFAIGLVLASEAANTAIEAIADFIHPNYHEKIGLIKDLGASIPTIASIISLIIAGFIYIPKIILLF
ncbi:diacylglycerol kinase family protein [Polaribacter sp. WD7]|uniref:diacylglycerol kinase family protein n=1 Tax=Polaribacter sp. WD7 TaxID=2269061 RepID=UPI000DF30391|nr:diacylglycerol kinase family protein [Polaribacter sp. WD7]RCS26776.1 diacylglycerol kinase family protein [Polaribacter sp. WD7]